MKRVALLYLRTGGGHHSAAKALAEQIRRTGGGIPLMTDPLEENRGFLKNLIEGGYARLSGDFRFAWPLFYRMNRSGMSVRGIHKITETLLTDTLVKMFRRDRPDKIVILHYLLIAPVRRALKELGIPGDRCITIVLDPFTVHPVWYRSNPFSIYCFSDRAARTILSGSPAGPDRVRRFPVIISDRFNSGRLSEPDRPGRPGRLLILGGGEGGSKSLQLLRVLIRHRPDLEIQFVCGKSESLFRRASRMVGRAGCQDRFRIFRFVDNLEVLISRSDLVLTKAGPASVMECLLLGKPLLLFDYMYGQEQGNVDFVEEKGLGRYIADPAELPEVLDYYLSSAYRREFRKRLDSLDLRTGTEPIVSSILEGPAAKCI